MAVDNTILVRRGSGTPSHTDFTEYELAYDYSGNKLYIRDGNAMVEISGDGTVDTSGTPVAQEYARFTDANTIEGRSAAGVRTDLGLNIGTNVQAYDTLLKDIADIDPDAMGNNGKILSLNAGLGKLELVTPSAGTITSVTGMTNNNVLTASGSTTISGESSLQFAGQFLSIQGNDPSNTYGVKEKLRIHRSGANTDRQLQIYEMRHSGGREFLQAFNLDITTDNSSGYTYTQGSYGGSSYIEFDNGGALKFYNDTSVSSGSRNAITPSLSMWIGGDNNILMPGKLGIGWTSGTPNRALDVKGGIELSVDDNTIDTNNFALRRGSSGVGHLDSPGNIRLNIDSNNNQTTAFFEICANASTTPVFKVGETGIVTTGTWNGTTIASAYLDADTAHLSGSQTFSGNKTFSASMNLGSELNFTGNGNKIIDIETLENNNHLTIRHHNPIGNVFENAIRLTANAGARLYYDGGERLQTTSDGALVTGVLTSNNRITSTGTDGFTIGNYSGYDRIVNNSNVFRFLTDGDAYANMQFATVTAGTWQGTAIASSYIADNSITAAKLYVSGNGTNGQVLKSDGDGTFSWFSLVSNSNASTLDNLDSTQFIRSDANDSVTGIITFEEAINMNATDSGERLFFKNNGTIVGDIGTNDTTWLRINQSTDKNIYTPRYIRADSGFFVDGASQGITGAGVFRAPNGSDSIPTYSFSNDTNTGMYLSSGDNLAFTTAGTMRMGLNDDGPNFINSGGISFNDRRIVTFKSNSNDRGAWNPWVSSIRNSGIQRHFDEEFEEGTNGVNLYNNAGGSNLVVSRITASADSIVPPNKTGKVIKVAYNGNGTTSPNYGGIYQTISSEENHTFVQMFQAKLPLNRYFVINENGQGTRNTSYWLTDHYGTGKWEWYARVSHCGDSGSFGSGGHISVGGGSDKAFNWYIASMTQYDVTESPYNYSVAGKGTSGQLLKADGDGTYSWQSQGGGSNLDADKLDGIQASQFLRSDAADTATGALTLGTQTWNGHITWNNGQNIYVAGESSIDVSGSGYFQVWDSGNGEPFIKCDVGQQVEIGDAGNRGLKVHGNSFINGQLRGGFGAQSTSGTTDWNHSTNARSGNGHTLLLSTHTNGPGTTTVNATNNHYYHLLNFEYAGYDNDGNMTQLAFPYSMANNDGARPVIRTRYNGTWSSYNSLVTANANGQIQAGMGTAALPSITFNGGGTSDTNTGILRTAADTIGFSTNGVTRFTMNGGGVLYVSSHVQAGSGGIQIWDGTHGFKTVLAKDSTYTKLLNNDGTVMMYMGDSGDAQMYYQANEHRFRNLGGSTYYARIGNGYIRNESNGSAAAPAFSWTNDPDLGFYRNGANNMRFSAGNAIRGTWNGDGLVLNGGSLGVNVAIPTTDGVIRAGNDVIAFYSSDERLKENVKPIENALDKVSNIRGVEFDWIVDKEIHANKGHDVGVIAQEIEKVLPEVVETRDNGYKAVKYEKIVSLLIEAVKEQQVQIDELKTKLGE